MLKKILRIMFYAITIMILLFIVASFCIQVNAWFHLGIFLSILIGVALFFSLLGIGSLISLFMDWLFR